MKKIQLIIDIDIKDEKIINDLNRIMQIIQNLLSNALKYAKNKIIVKITQMLQGDEFQFEVFILLYIGNR